MNKAYLFGPFVGELEWEMYRFAPYAIHLKKESPDYKLIVYTRKSRFDLYGKYADVLVPLNLKYEKDFTQCDFGIKKFQQKHYDIIKDYFYDKYDKRFNIIDHFIPDIDIWRYRIKWQFPRSKMNYDFQPRSENEDVIHGLFDSSTNVYVTEQDSEIRHMLHGRGYNPIMNDWVYDLKNWNKQLDVSFVGCVMICLRNCKFVVGNMDSWITKLALLLKIPVVSIDETMTYDSIYLLNPFDIPVINCTNIEEGIDIYEDNF